jgi:hypothetical protein
LHSVVKLQRCGETEEGDVVGSYTTVEVGVDDLVDNINFLFVGVVFVESCDSGDYFVLSEGGYFGYAMTGGEDPGGGDDGASADVLVEAEKSPLVGNLVGELAVSGILAVDDAFAGMEQSDLW